ncbi:chromosome segregation DNA-binding protein [Candidatus Koribacter versatilis Ellin345]|uniref:Chromosome segregation DNA-binding protein n=1 Tax=Koribacter versatilis (strain Ellin345) TaxID=204669 RepID=Q1IVQ5_KORVE|nr:chromosome segregation DNA-binding protein [Candidatus Koribacter versatilis Ellin345]
MTTMIEKRKVLGRGLESLLPASRATAAPAVATAPAPPTGDMVRELPIDHIDRNPYQTRTQWDETALNELAASIRVSGVLQPVTVRPHGDRFQLITGERRWRASQLAGKTTVPAIVRQVSNEQAMEMTIIENLQREDLNPMEQARAYERLAREFSLTQEQMAQRTGKDRSSVANFMRLLKLPAEVQAMVEGNKLSFGHAKALMPLESPEAIIRLAQRVATLSMSVRQTEGAVVNLLNPPEKKQPEERQVDPNVREVEREMERNLGVRVQIADRKGKGKIVIEYKSLEDFDRVVEVLQRR